MITVKAVEDRIVYDASGNRIRNDAFVSVLETPTILRALKWGDLEGEPAPEPPEPPADDQPTQQPA